MEINTGQWLLLFLFFSVFIIARILLASDIKITNKPAENMNIQKKSPQFIIQTPDEKIFDTKTLPPTPVQAGFPGNTLPPEKPNVNFPSPDHKFTEFKWKEIPMDAPRIYIGAVMEGKMRKMKALAFFPIIQTPPQNPDDLYGDMSIFVEGGKVGLRLLPGSMIFDYKFDFMRNGPYKIEMVVQFVSVYVTRVELWIDGAATGLSYTIRGQNMRQKIHNLPTYITMDDKVKSTYLQSDPQPVN